MERQDLVHISLCYDKPIGFWLGFMVSCGCSHIGTCCVNKLWCQSMLLCTMDPICDSICCANMWDHTTECPHWRLCSIGAQQLTLLKECMDIQKRNKKRKGTSPKPILCKSLPSPPSRVQPSPLPFPQWEPRLCHHAAHCGVDKGGLAVGAHNIWFQ